MSLVVAGAEAEAADHPEMGQVGAITDFVDVVCADAILDVAVGRAVRRLESGFERLHPSGDEQRRGISGDYVGR